MARKRLYEYTFTPGTAGLGTVAVPDRYNLADILAIYDTTYNVAIYNFADPTLGGTVSWAAGVTNAFPAAYAGVTTITLDLNTSAYLSTDKLAIYVEDRNLQIQPWDYGMDAIGRERVSNPQSLIDADFEYGLQNTKWEAVSTTNNIPSFYEDVGADIVFNTNGYISLLAGDDLITSNVDTAVRMQNPGTAQWVANDFTLLISQTQGNATPLTSTFLTANVNSSAERTFTVGTSSGISAGDNVLIIGRPTTGGTTVATANITSNATTTVNCANVSAAGIVDGNYVIVLTDTANTYETMAVTNVSGNDSFRGKVYHRLVEDITGISLYGYTNESDEIPNEIVKDMAEGLEATEWRDSYIQNYDIEEQEFKDLVKMFRLHADAGHYLVAWY